MSQQVVTHCLVLALLGTVADIRAEEKQPPASNLAVKLTQLRSSKGQTGCLLFKSASGFPDDEKLAIQRVWCRVEGSTSICRFTPIPKGIYAVACIHDENGNGKLDTNFLGIPTEGFVVSNEAKGFMSAPSFKAARFSFSGQPSQLTLRMAY